MKLLKCILVLALTCLIFKGISTLEVAKPVNQLAAGGYIC